jgi:1,4-dihydroxy-2-naphthoate octaprenyltransferase
MKKENLILTSSPSILKSYWIASRPKTWIASISPVIIGISLSMHEGMFSLSIAILTLFFSLFIQIGTNFVNDAFDFLSGVDTIDRKGPLRATAQGWITPAQMLKASGVVFGLALLFALPLMIQAGLWSFALALICILFGVLYTGGPKPLGYLGLGEPLVFIFFGPIATCGTYFLQTGTVTPLSLLASFAPACLSTAILVTNNLRDETTDRSANKKTLIVRFGKKFGSYEYTALILLASFIPFLLVFQNQMPLKVLLCSLILPFSWPAIKKSFQFKDSLPTTSFLLFLYTALFFIALW